MSDLIERQAAIDAVESFDILDGYSDQQELIYRLRQLPSAESEWKKGEWQITDAYPHNVYCSKCHKRFAQTHWAVWEDGSLPRNFCPNCGADMREEKA